MKKWFYLRVDLALLGTITIHLIFWPMLLVCAGSPLKNIYSSLDENIKLKKLENDESSSSYQAMILTNNISYEVSTKTKTNNQIAHVFNNNFLRIVSINDENNDKLYDINNSTNDNNHNNNNSQPISSIYEIFFMKNKENIENLNALMRTDRSAHFTLNNNNNNNNASKTNGTKRVKKSKVKSSSLDRNERSANLSHITGSARKIQLYIKNRFVQLLPDGTVNGTTDDLSDYTILQRTTVNVGQIKIQGVATCLFLCMNSCGISYGSIEFTDDCIFNESMEQHHYNTYSSTQHSNAKRTLYLGLNRHGQPRKIQLPASRQLGKLATYTKSLTQTVAHERVDALITRLYGSNHLRHGLKQLCDTGKVLKNIKVKGLKNNSNTKCNALQQNKHGNKKKKKKRKCENLGQQQQQLCSNKTIVNSNNNTSNSNNDQEVNTKINVSSNSNNNNNNNNNNKKKASSNNNHQKKCNINNNNNNNNSTEECVKGKTAKKKKLAKKNGGQGSKEGGKQNGKKKAARTLTTTLKPEEEYIDHDVIDLSLEEEEDYDEMNTDMLNGDRDTVNFNEDHDEYNL